MLPSSRSPQFGIFVARQVAALRRAGVDVRVAAIADERVGRVRTPAKYAALAGRALYRAAVDRPDAIVAHMLVPPGLIAAITGRVARCPVVLVAHGQDVANAERSPRLRDLTQRAVRGAATVVCVSDDLAERLRAVVDVACPHVVLDVGIDREAFRPGDRDEAARRAGAVGVGRPLVVQVGNLIDRKNPERLAEAVLRLRERHPEATLWLAGQGPRRRRLASLPHVRLLGAVPPERVADVLRAADVAALVALSEGYGLGALEAVGCGVPTVVSASIPVASDLPESAAVTVNPLSAEAIADGIERALALPRDDTAGQAAADAHAVDAQARRLIAIVDRLVGGG